MKYRNAKIYLFAITAILLVATTELQAQRRFGNYRYRGNYYAYNYRPARPVISVNFGSPHRYNSYYRRPVIYGQPHTFIHFGPAFGIRINVLPVGYYPFYIGANPYYYYEGVYYRPYSSGGYEVVKPPLGATVKRLPAGAKVTVIDGVKYYELGGTYYQEDINDKNKLRYKVVGTDGVLNTGTAAGEVENDNSKNGSTAVTDDSKAATSPTKQLPETGSKVDQLPQGSKAVIIKKEKYYLSPDGVYYQEVIDDSKVRYVVTGNSKPEE